MAKGTQALVQLDANFNLRAKSLAEEAVRLWDASQKLTQELLEFSHRYWELAEEAKKLIEQSGLKVQSAILLSEAANLVSKAVA